MNRKSQIVNGKSNSLLPLRYYTGGQVPRRTGNEPSSYGFTLIELVVVIVALAILVGTAIVRFQVTDQDKSTIAADQLIADIQYVQMRAMGIGSNQGIEFRYKPGDLSAYKILDNAGSPIEEKRLPDKVTVNDNNFTNILRFNSLGEPFYNAGSNCTGTITGLAGNCSITLRDNVTIMVYAITGKTCRYDTANNRCF